MKANAPDKLYISDSELNDAEHCVIWFKSQQNKNDIEYIRKDAFIEKAVEGRVIDDGGEIHLVVPELPIITRNMDDGEKVKVLIFK